jgi:hypothetical protein
MWRVLRNIYEAVESSVLVGDTQSRFFRIDVGVRQGCLMSPILFALYINGLAEELKQANIGAKVVQYNEEQIGILMFADDIGLVSDQKAKLEQLMEKTYQ